MFVNKVMQLHSSRFIRKKYFKPAGAYKREILIPLHSCLMYTSMQIGIANLESLPIECKNRPDAHTKHAYLNQNIQTNSSSVFLLSKQTRKILPAKDFLLVLQLLAHYSVSLGVINQENSLTAASKFY